MGNRHVIAIRAQIVGGQMSVGLAPTQLMTIGCNIHVEVATAEAFVSDPANPLPRKSIVVIGHLDTGASHTHISPLIAQYLGLSQVGVGKMHTAGGQTSNPTYAIDLTFVGCSLAPRNNLAVGSCALPFTMEEHAKDPGNLQNFGVLIGRDVMSAWHMAWDGPSSSVMIYD